MFINELNESYFIWLCKLVDSERYSKVTSFTKLLRQLHGTEFQYIIRQDYNREADGRDLRSRFCYELGYDDTNVKRYLDVGTASVLEVLVALSVRCEDQFMEDLEYGNRTSKWFWDMIENLGLKTMTDSNYDAEYVRHILCRFMNREYEANGQGGLFTVHTDRDMRSVEIWYQMCWYINEHTE